MPGIENSIKLVVGLGNPGADYAQSRHNAGFMTVEKFLEAMPAGRFTESHNADSRLFTGKVRGKALMLQMPLTYMNLSGNAVALISRRFKLQAREILVISDDLDLPVGKLRLRAGGSDGGHNGLKSIISELGSADFIRLRIGIGRPAPGKTVDYVLNGFEGEEEKIFLNGIGRAAEAIQSLFTQGLTRTMNIFNAPVKDDNKDNAISNQ